MVINGHQGDNIRCSKFPMLWVETLNSFFKIWMDIKLLWNNDYLNLYIEKRSLIWFSQCCDITLR